MTDMMTTQLRQLRYDIIRTRSGDQLHTEAVWLRADGKYNGGRGRTSCGARVARSLERGSKVNVRAGLLCKKCFDGLKREFLFCELVAE